MPRSRSVPRSRSQPRAAAAAPEPAAPLPEGSTEKDAPPAPTIPALPAAAPALCKLTSTDSGSAASTFKLTSTDSGSAASTFKPNLGSEYYGFTAVAFVSLVSFAYLEELGMSLFLVVGAAYMAAERIWPDLDLPPVKLWYTRSFALNCVQLVLSHLGSATWEKHAQRWVMFELGSAEWVKASPALGGFIAYLLVTFVFYWWHRWRHESEFLWVAFHQVHHSPARLEILTSFYKAPYEIAADSILVALCHYTILGLDERAMMYTAAYSCFAEFVYHMNIRSPPFIGYFFQRPESHRVHHLRDSQYLSKNYSDLPLWDILFGTFENPPANTDWSKLKFGFPEEDENRLPEMVFKLTNVRKPHVSWWKWSTLSYSHMPVVPSIISGGSAGSAIGPRRPNKHVNRVVSLTKLHIPTPSEVSRKSIVFWAWFIMAVAYTASGLDKLYHSPSWRDGSAVRLVLQNPLARDNALRTLLLAAPPLLLKIATWGSLVAELWFVVATMFRPSRKLASLALVGMHLGIVAVVNFADLTFGVLLIHAFTMPSLLLGTSWEWTSFAGRYYTWFPFFRRLLGAYLMVHFLQLVPYAPALFSDEGMFPDASILPTAPFLPTALLALASPEGVQMFVVALTAAAALLAFSRPAAMSPLARAGICVFLWAGWALLFNRNPFINNPGMPFVGWILLATALWDDAPEESEVEAEAAAANGGVKQLQAKPPRWGAAAYGRLVGINLLGMLGCVQVVAFALKLPRLQGLAAATVASPLPLVFSAYQGHETFANGFAYTAVDANGDVRTGVVDPVVYSRFSAAYNYRNAYGVALAYGPFFTTSDRTRLRDLVLRYGFCTPGHVVKATNITGGVALAKLTFTVSRLADAAPLPPGAQSNWSMTVDCGEAAGLPVAPAVAAAPAVDIEVAPVADAAAATPEPVVAAPPQAIDGAVIETLAGETAPIDAGLQAEVASSSEL